MRKILFVVSPSLALYIQCKNILKEAINDGDIVDIFLPKPLTYKNILSNLYVIENDLKIDKFLVLSNPLNPFSIKKLKVSEIKDLTYTYSFKLQLFLRISLSRIIGRFNLRFARAKIGDMIRLISSTNLFKKLIYINQIKSQYGFVLYDIFEENKSYIFPYLSSFYGLYRISLFHGNGISWMHFGNKPFWTPLNKLKILDFTGLNKSLYNWSLINKNFDYQVIGIPSHSYEKNNLLKNKNKILKKLRSDLDLSEKTKFIALASRPDDNNWCNSCDRKLYLKIIGNYLFEKEDLHLLIRAHPKEKSYTKQDWANLLGVKPNSKLFSITEKMPLELAAISEFGFSFVSDCCIDFACFGKPMIELTSEKDTLFMNNTPFFTYDGHPMTAPSALKLAINIKNIDELNCIFKNLDITYKKLSKDVRKAYYNCYELNAYKPGIFINLLKEIINVL